MIEHVLIRGVVMGENAAGQKLVQPLMDNADGLRIWTDDKCLIPASDVATVVRCRDCVYNENGCCTHSEPYDDTRYRPDYFCADGLGKDNG